MVVRDESDLIEGALDAITPHLSPMDEIIVVDGGSKDETLMLARETLSMTRINYKVVKHPQEWKKREWKKEGECRNKAWSECSNDWILSIDADEAFPTELYERIPELINNYKMKAYYFPTINFIESTKKIIDPEQYSDYIPEVGGEFHIRLANKKYFSWVGDIHASLWLNGNQVVNPNSYFVSVLEHPLFHYARVKKNVVREYGGVPQKLIDFDSKHPRKEFD